LVLWHRDLGHLEDGVASVLHDLCTNLHKLLPQAGQQPSRSNTLNASPRTAPSRVARNDSVLRACLPRDNHVYGHHVQDDLREAVNEGRRNARRLRRDAQNTRNGDSLKAA